jgi:hypothetical protein
MGRKPQLPSLFLQLGWLGQADAHWAEVNIPRFFV